MVVLMRGKTNARPYLMCSDCWRTLIVHLRRVLTRVARSCMYACLLASPHNEEKVCKRSLTFSNKVNNQTLCERL
jgi:hypothetical protein